MFNLRKFLYDVFDPQSGETVLFLVDLPHHVCPDNEDWQERRGMAEEWRLAMNEIAQKRHFDVLPTCYYPATGQNSAALPEEIVKQVKGATLVLAMTEWSASAPLGQIIKAEPYFRVASMPGILRRMEKSALSADYAEVQRRCKVVAELMGKAQYCKVEFSSGDECLFDLRWREVETDDGYLHSDKKEMQLINLPSGEVLKAPYEGEREGVESETEGKLPICDSRFNATVTFDVEKNKIVTVLACGSGDAYDEAVGWWHKFFKEDEARRNIAECAFGVNPCAVVTGNVLEDEKAGFHWALGLSSHLGGVFGPEKFRSPETQVHEDFVYAKESPIWVVSAKLVYAGNEVKEIIRGGEYLIF